MIICLLVYYNTRSNIKNNKTSCMKQDLNFLSDVNFFSYDITYSQYWCLVNIVAINLKHHNSQQSRRQFPEQGITNPPSSPLWV